MKEKKILNSDPNYPENFWPRIIFLLFSGAFIYWVMTSPNAEAAMHIYLIEPIRNRLSSL